MLAWYAGEARSLAWRRTSDAYAVLVSEVMLQQTQAARVEPVFEAFLARFPTVSDLAAAEPAAVVTAWRGLGYNRRAVRLQAAARAVVVHHGGRVPADLGALRSLPGVGEYTARAIRAFAHGLDDAPVDTNVARVLARAVAGCRLSGLRLQRVADAVVPSGRGRDWSAALMDLGSRHCTARAPRCDGCPLSACCAWRLAGGQDPARSPAARPAAVPFRGSDRWCRGRLVEALRRGPVVAAELARAAGLEPDDNARALILAERLASEGLAQRDGDVWRLPGRRFSPAAPRASTRP